MVLIRFKSPSNLLWFKYSYMLQSNNTVKQSDTGAFAISKRTTPLLMTLQDSVTASVTLLAKQEALF